RSSLQRDSEPCKAWLLRSFSICSWNRALSVMETTARDCNTKVTPAHLCVKTQLKPRNRIRPLETIQVTQKPDTSHHKYTLTPVWCQRPPRGEVSKR